MTERPTTPPDAPRGRGGGGHQRAVLIVASVALATDVLLYDVAVPLLPEIARQSGASAASIGALFATYAAALVAATPLAGIWLDRRGAREPMLVGLLVLAAATLLFAFARDPFALFGARLAQGAAAGVTWTASLALLAAHSPPERRGAAMGIALSAFGFGTLIGSPFGGIIGGWLGTEAPFLVIAVLLVADGVARWFLVPIDDAQPARAQRFGELRQEPGLALAAAMTMLGAALIAFLEPVLPLHLADRADAGSAAIGLTFGLAALVAAVLPPLVGALSSRLNPVLLGTAGCVVAALALVAIGRTSTVVAAAAALAFVAVGATLLLTPTLSLMADLAERRTPPAYGAVYALYTLAYAAGLTAAPLIAGGATEAVDFETATLVIGALTLCAALALATRGARGGEQAPA